MNQLCEYWREFVCESETVGGCVGIDVDGCVLHMQLHLCGRLN